METRMSKYEWRRVNDECIALYIRNILHYHVEFDQHENIISIDFEGGPCMSMDELVVVEGNVYRVMGVRDIIKMDLDSEFHRYHRPYDMEVRFEAVRLM